MITKWARTQSISIFGHYAGWKKWHYPPQIIFLGQQKIIVRPTTWKEYTVKAKLSSKPDLFICHGQAVDSPQMLRSGTVNQRCSPTLNPNNLLLIRHPLILNTILNTTYQYLHLYDKETGHLSKKIIIVSFNSDLDFVYLHKPKH